MELNEKIKNARTNAGLTQEEVAEKIKVTRQTLSNWETGKFLPDIASIINLSEIYKVSLDELLKGDHKYKSKMKKANKVAKTNEKVITATGVILLIVLALYSISKFTGGSFYDFSMAALPWVLYAVGLAFVITYLNMKSGK